MGDARGLRLGDTGRAGAQGVSGAWVLFCGPWEPLTGRQEAGSDLDCREDHSNCSLGNRRGRWGETGAEDQLGGHAGK